MKILFAFTLLLSNFALAKNLDQKLVYEFYDGTSRSSYSVWLASLDEELETYYFTTEGPKGIEHYDRPFESLLTDNEIETILRQCEGWYGGKLEFFTYQGDTVLSTCRFRPSTFGGDLTFLGGHLFSHAEYIWVGNGPAWTGVYKALYRSYSKETNSTVLYSLTLKNIE